MWPMRWKLNKWCMMLECHIQPKQIHIFCADEGFHSWSLEARNGQDGGETAITIDFYDPFAETAGAHFNELLKEIWGTDCDPKLSQAKHQIVYKTFDMARKKKEQNANVMRYLADIAKSAVTKVGIFHNKPRYHSQETSTVIGQSNEHSTVCYWQVCARLPLCALGVLDSPNLEFDTDCVRMLESLYEDHGDTLALQYGGSQLVHRIKTYRKTAPWTSQGNDIMQTLSRYYSNTFSDSEKQNAINLFLGVFQPEESQPPIWEYTSDYYFHHKPIIFSLKSLTQWWDSGVLKSLPFAYNDLTKACSELIQVHSKRVEMIDSYKDYYRPYELSVLADFLH
nr:unnamed protein product [Callosobruchus chinensis]